MPENLVQEIMLDNGLKLDLYDESRVTVAGHWLVRLVGRVEIKVADVSIPQDSSGSEIKKVLGPVVVFEQKKDRHFVDEKEKDAAFKAVCESFLESIQSYLSHPDFPRKFVMQQFREQAKKRQWEENRAE